MSLQATLYLNLEVSKQLSEWFSRGRDAGLFTAQRLPNKRAINSAPGNIICAKVEGSYLTDRILFTTKHFNDIKPEFWGFLAGKPSRQLKTVFEEGYTLSEANNRSLGIILKTRQKEPLLITNYPYFLQEPYLHNGSIAIMGMGTFMSDEVREHFMTLGL